MRKHNRTLTVYLSYVVMGVASAVVGVLWVLSLAAGRWERAGDWLAGLTGWPTALCVAAILLLTLLVLLVFIAVLAAISGYVGTREVRNDLSQLASASAQFASGRLQHRVAIDGNDDLAMAANQFNLMAQRLQDQVRALQESAHDNAQLRLHLEQSATLRERERVRRELHDRISQDLFGLAMLSSTAVAQKENKPDDALALLAEIEGLAKRTQSSMRALLLELRPLELQQDGNLAGALSRLTYELATRTGLAVSLSVLDVRQDDGYAGLPRAIEDALFLIAQEALVNAIRHAEANSLSVQLTVERARVLLRIADDGKGLDTLPESEKLMSMGLRSMRERAQALGGSCHMEGQSAGTGTVVLIVIPRIDEE